MKSMEELIAFINAEKHLLVPDSKLLFAKLKHKFSDFLAHLEEEDEETKTAFHILLQAAYQGKQLTHEEKIEIEDRLKDVLKTIGLIALTVLPGGTLFFILANFLKLNKYIIPSAFLKKG